MLNEQPNVAHVIIERIVCAAKARAASRAAGQTVRRKIGVNRRLTLPGKLADCSSTNPNDCELFIVEGDSAGGSAKQGRDRHTQAVLPLRGKVLNTISSPKKGISDNKELSNIVSALGCGVGDSLNVDRLRYGKVIILTDADADGMHISTLLMAFFYTHMRGVIEQGCLYIGHPPLYGVFPAGGSQASSNGKVAASKKGKGSSTRSSAKKGSKSVHWAYSDDELQKVLSKTSIRSPRITRYKGLGEMNPETLWETTLDPRSRTLLRVTMDDENIVKRELTALMGSDPTARFKLIQDSAHEVALDL
jgi:DNA gyrase subunit B/topoisomerase-4 subunit B